MRSWASFAVFFAVTSAIVGLLHFYLFTRVVRGADLSPATTRALGWFFAAMALATPVGLIASNLLDRPLKAIIGYAVYTWVGLVVLMFFLTLASEVVRLGQLALTTVDLVTDTPERRTFLGRVLAGCIAGGAAVLGVGAFMAARAIPAVKKVNVSLSRFPAPMNGFRIVQLTDIHVGPTIDGAWLEDIVTRVNELDADVVAITGDLVDGDVASLRDHVAPLGKLKAKHGVYFVTGNHEYYSGVDEWIEELTRLGIRVLRNEHVSIGGAQGFDLAGVDDWRAKGFGRGHGADLERALAGRDEAREVILLAHQPKQAPEAARHGVGLQLSGHTHAGQIFPWGFFVRIDQPFVAGLDRLEGLQIYTSAGTGYWGPPMRLAAPSEITLLTVTRG